MTDMHKTWVLRGFVFGVAVLSALLATVIVDVLLEKLGSWPRPIEAAVFCYVLLTKIWNWASRRLWVGNIAPIAGHPEGQT